MAVRPMSSESILSKTPPTHRQVRRESTQVRLMMLTILTYTDEFSCNGVHPESEVSLIPGLNSPQTQLSESVLSQA